MSSPTSPGSTGSNAAGSRSYAGNGSSGPAEQKLKEMREDVSRLAGVVSHVAERRIARTRATAEITMRDHPLATVSLALVAGFLVGLAVIPRREQREHGMLSGLRSGMRDWELPDLSRYAPRMPAASNISAEPITSRLEQVLDSLSRVDTGSIASPAMEKLKDWYGTFMSKVRS